jgi:hypothetical protein
MTENNTSPKRTGLIELLSFSKRILPAVSNETDATMVVQTGFRNKETNPGLSGWNAKTRAFSQF